MLDSLLKVIQLVKSGDISKTTLVICGIIALGSVAIQLYGGGRPPKP